MGNIEDTLAKRMNQLGIKRQIDAAGVVEAAGKEIAKILPREDFEVISFKEGALKVYASSSSAANEVSLHKNQLFIKISKIKRLRIVLQKEEEKEINL